MNFFKRFYSIAATALLAISLVLFSQCRKDNFITDQSAKLEFSQDSVLFDTVFSTSGSTTFVFKVFNKHSEHIRISSIDLEGGSQSQFRMAVDGINGWHHEDIDIFPNDSIFIFVEVTVDPGNVNDPFVIHDEINFITNGNQQTVVLEAWGQDAYYHGNLESFFNPFELGCNEVWNPDKPHVIYGIVAVDSSCSLTINPGTEVYVHAKSGLYVYKGNLTIGEGGSPETRVVFQGDRLEQQYADVPGQWGIQLDFLVETGFSVEVASIVRGGIWIFESPSSSIKYCELKNGTIGIQVDTSYSSGYDVEISNTIISNMSAIGLWTQQAHVKGENLLINNCGQACAALTIGGKYDFKQCTFANYWQEGNRTAPAFLLNNYYEDVNQNIQVRPLEEAIFRNCIMWGNNNSLEDFNEFVVDLEEPDFQSYEFSTCIVDTDEDVNDDGLHWLDMRVGAPSFKAPYESDFHVSDNWNGLMEAGTAWTSFDLDGFGWVDVRLGCYTNQ